MRLSRLGLPRAVATCALVTACGLRMSADPQLAGRLDRAGERWVATTLREMTLAEKVGQIIAPRVESEYLSSDSRTYDELVRLVHEYRVGGFVLFGGTEPRPDVLLNAGYGTVTLGQPLAAASLTGRLQAIAPRPLLVSADFETGVGFRIEGATRFPRAMAFGAAADERLAFEAGRITATEARALGVHVNLAPVADVNNNPRNPVINTRSFGEDPEQVGRLAAAYVRGLHAGGALATLKHFPGHGDTDVDSHLGMPVLEHPLERLEQIELPPFRAGVAAGADVVMTSHLAVPAIEANADWPATFSRAIVTGLLRGDLDFGGLIFTDAMDMAGVTRIAPPAEAAVRAVKAGHDVVLVPVDPAATFEGLRQAVRAGEIDEDRLDMSVTRILQAKARLGLHRTRSPALESVPVIVGTRRHGAVADAVSRRAVTLIKDERGDVPLRVARDRHVLYLSVLDSVTGWRIAAPSRTLIPELEKRWPNVTAIELSDRTTAAELELVRAMAPRFDAIVAGIFVRVASGMGRVDLAPPLVRLLQRLSRVTSDRGAPYVAVFIGNPYTALAVSEIPAMILTYDLYDRAEAAAVRALAGEAPITGKLPIALPGMFPVGHGLERPARGPTTLP